MNATQKEHEQEFFLQAKIKLIQERCAIGRKSDNKERMRKEFFNSQTIILIPSVMPTEYTKFRLVYFPENIKTSNPPQFVSLISHPIHKPCRILFCYPDKHSDQFYFRVSTMSIEEEIIDNFDSLKDRFLGFTIVKQSDEILYSV